MKNEIFGQEKKNSEDMATAFNSKEVAYRFALYHSKNLNLKQWVKVTQRRVSVSI